MPIAINYCVRSATNFKECWMRRAIADLLFMGKVPSLAFERMKTLGGLIMEAIVEFLGGRNCVGF